MDAQMPKLNPLLANGLATTHLRHIEAYIDDVFKTIAADFPPQLKYVGYQRMDPIREFNQVTKANANRRSYDVAVSYLYMVEYHFEYDDGVEKETIVRPIYLPFVGEAGMLYVSGSRFFISPILNDRVISVGSDHVFARVSKARMTFFRLPYHYRANGLTENVHVVWSDLYHKQDKVVIKPTVRAKCTLPHYLFCKYGVSEAFKRYVKANVVVGYQELEDQALYPQSEWVVCRSSWNKPKGVRTLQYIPSEIRLAIRRDEYTEDARAMIAGFFYTVDHLSTMAQAEHVNSPAHWLLMLGHFIWSGDISASKLYSDASNHIASLDVYLDSITATQLVEIGMPCEDIYDLLFKIVSNFNKWMLTSRDKVSTMYDKELAILLFVCSEFTNAMNNLFFKLNAAMAKELTLKKVKDLMTQYLKPGLAFRLNRTHGEVSTTSTSGDNKALKITNIVVPQTKSSKRGSTTVSIKDPSLQLHASIAEVGGYACMPKSAPDGRSRINQYLQISPTGLVLRNEELRPMIDEAQERIRRV